MGHTDVAEFLVSAKADLNAITDNNISPLKMAVLTKNTGLVDLYIKSGARVHFKRSENEHDDVGAAERYDNANVLAEAASLNCDVPMLKLLLEHKVDPTLKTDNGQSVVSVLRDQFDTSLEEILGGKIPEHVVHKNKNKKEVVEWWSFEDEEGDIFYFNTRIRMSTWSKPENVQIEHKGKVEDNKAIMA